MYNPVFWLSFRCKTNILLVLPFQRHREGWGSVTPRLTRRCSPRRRGLAKLEGLNFLRRFPVSVFSRLMTSFLVKKMGKGFCRRDHFWPPPPKKIMKPFFERFWFLFFRIWQIFWSLQNGGIFGAKVHFYRTRGGPIRRQLPSISLPFKMFFYSKSTHRNHIYIIYPPPKNVMLLFDLSKNSSFFPLKYCVISFFLLFLLLFFHRI